MDEQKVIQQDQAFLQQLEKEGIVVKPADIEKKAGFKKLDLTSEQKIQISGFLQHMTAMGMAGKMAGAYSVKFPKGLPHTLMSLKQGGFGSSIRVNGRIAGTASFYPMLGQAAVMGVFTMLSIATGQYFLTQINKELHAINRKLDEILAFLYGDKKAELLSELEFIQYTCDNYASVMECEEQRIATLFSIQNSKKIAMKDIRFYKNDLEKKTILQKKEEQKNFEDYQFLSNRLENEIGEIGENLHLSLQLYFVSSLMEVYYAQNFTEGYVYYLEEDIKNCFKVYVKEVPKLYREFRSHFDHCKRSVPKKQSEIDECKRKLENLEKSFEEDYDVLEDKLKDALSTVTRSTEYYLEAGNEGLDVYYKAV